MNLFWFILATPLFFCAGFAWRGRPPPRHGGRFPPPRWPGPHRRPFESPSQDSFESELQELKDEFLEKLNSNENKLLQAVSEIDRLKEGDQALSAQVARLNREVKNLTAKVKLLSDNRMMCLPYLDIMFVVGGSGSVGARTFEEYKTWLINQTMRFYCKFAERAQVGVLQHSNRDDVSPRIHINESQVFKVPLHLGECLNNEACVTQDIRNMPYLTGQTYTYSALWRVVEREFLRSTRYNHSKKFIIVVTDGLANDGAYLSKWYQQYVETGNVTAVAVGVGNNAPVEQLRIIANGGRSDDKVLTAGNSFSTVDIVAEIEKSLCRNVNISATSLPFCSCICIKPTPIETFNAN